MTHPDNFKLVRLSIENAVCKLHCSVCEGQDHHWMDDCDDTGEPILACKHCDTYMPYPDDDPYDDGSCWNCGGEGFIFDCIDGACEDAEIGCDDCTKRCWVCTPKSKDHDALVKILSDAIKDAGQS